MCCSQNTCCCCLLCVHEQEVAIIQRFGKFSKVASPGLSFLPWFCCATVGATLNTRVRELEVKCETKTRDNVFVTLIVAVQYKINEEDAYTAFYRLANPVQQITAYVCDVLRSSVPKIELDAVFETKEDIAEAVKVQLEKTLESVGYKIIRALVIGIDPDARVKQAMNNINSAQRMRVATAERAEADKITTLKSAEAEAESKHLSGLGIARQRKAIADGLRDSVVSYTDGVQGANAQQVMDLLLITQYYDTLKDLSANSYTSTIFLTHAPGSVAEVSRQIRAGTAPVPYGNMRGQD